MLRVGEAGPGEGLWPLHPEPEPPTPAESAPSSPGAPSTLSRAPHPPQAGPLRKDLLSAPSDQLPPFPPTLLRSCGASSVMRGLRFEPGKGAEGPISGPCRAWLLGPAMLPAPCPPGDSLGRGPHSPPLWLAPSLANPHGTQGLGMRPGLRSGPPHAAERLPCGRCQGLERGQPHTHRRDQRPRQPHQCHLHQQQAYFHCLQVGARQGGTPLLLPASPGQAGGRGPSPQCRPHSTPAPCLPSQGTAQGWGWVCWAPARTTHLPPVPQPLEHPAPAPALVPSRTAQAPAPALVPSRDAQPCPTGSRSDGLFFLLPVPTSSLLSTSPFLPDSDCRVKLWNYVPGLTPCLPRRVLAIKGRATTMP